MIGLLLGVAFLSQLISFLVSASETACLTVGPARVRTLREEGFQGAEALVAVREQSESVLASVLLLGTLFNVLAAGALVVAASFVWGPPGAVVAVPLTAVGALLLGEVIPRGLGSRFPVRLALRSAPLLLSLSRRFGGVLSPVLLLEGVLAGRNGDASSAEERELREMAAIGQRQGVLGEEENQLVERAFRLDELTAWDVMTPRVDIFAWKDALRLEEVIGELRSVPHSRIPVYGENIDDITGIVYVREAYDAYVSGRQEILLAEIAREPFFLPGAVPLTRLLKDFQSRRLHLGIVADEFGGTDGLVTLEDVLEELVGEIEDETDIQEEAPVRISGGEIEVDGSTELREVNMHLGISLPVLEHRSLNGYILEEMGRVPEAGESVERDGVEIEIVEASETQVLRARLRKTGAGRGEGVV